MTEDAVIVGAHRKGDKLYVRYRLTGADSRYFLTTTDFADSWRKWHALFPLQEPESLPGLAVAIEPGERALPSVVYGPTALTHWADSPAWLWVEARESEVLKKALCPPGEIRNNEFGDYGFWTWDSKSVLIEHKTVADLLASLQNGRLNAQLYGMADQCDVPILLIEGFYSQDSHGKLTHAGRTHTISHWYAESYLLALQEAGVRIVQCVRSHLVAPTIWKLVEFYQHQEHRRLRTRPSAAAFAPTLTVQERVLASFPGVSKHRAAAVLAHFGSLGAALAAPPVEWQKIAGIGAGTASGVRAILDAQG